MEASLDAFFLFFYRQALISIFFVLVFTANKLLLIFFMKIFFKILFLFTANKLLFNFFFKIFLQKKRPEIFGTFFAIKKYY
jgi:hypothetical protein